MLLLCSFLNIYTMMSHLHLLDTRPPLYFSHIFGSSDLQFKDTFL